MVELGAHPAQPLDDPRPDDRRFLADAGREHEGVEPAQHCRQAAGMAGNLLDEKVERKARLGIGAAQQIAHVVADAGKAFEAALEIKKVLQLGGRHRALGQQKSSTPGSIAPQRVPIGSPSSAVKPMVLSTERPSRRAHMEAPLPRWATMTRLPAKSGAISARRPATNS